MIRVKGNIGLLVAITSVIMLVSYFTFRASPQIRVTMEAYERILDGMTVAEVETVLGGPAGDYRMLPSTEQTGFVFSVQSSPGARLIWRGDDGEVFVTFDDSGGARARSWTETKTENRGPFKNLWWRFERSWRGK